jgi:hypothetical protein
MNMRKLIAVLMTLCLLASLSVCVFAEPEDIESPTDKPVFTVTYLSNGEGSNPDEYIEEFDIVVLDDNTVELSAYEKDNKNFIGFTISGEYDIIAGSLDPIATRGKGTLVGYIHIAPKSDLVVHAHYDEIVTEPTTGDTGDDSPQTGDSMMTWIVAAVALVGIFGCAVATKKLSGKKN